MSDVREAIARALARSLWEGAPETDEEAERAFLEDGDWPKSSRDSFRKDADAVLAAIEASAPTEAMLDAGLREYVGSERYARDHEYCDANFRERLRRAFRAMLAASKQEKDQP